MLGRCPRPRAYPSSDAPGSAGPGPRTVDRERREDGPLFTVSTQRAAHALVVVRVVGEVDLLAGPGVDRALREAVRLAAADGHRPGGATGPVPAIPTWTPEVLCDLDAVTFFGAAVVSVLLLAAERARTREVMLTVTATCRPVRRVLSLLDLDDRLHSATHTTTPRTSAPPTPLVGTAPSWRAVP